MKENLVPTVFEGESRLCQQCKARPRNGEYTLCLECAEVHDRKMMTRWKTDGAYVYYDFTYE